MRQKSKRGFNPYDAIRAGVVVTAYPDRDQQDWAQMIGVTPMTWAKWESTEPMFTEAIHYAREMVQKGRAGGKMLTEFVAGHLSEEAKELWDELHFWEDHPDQAKQARLLVEKQTLQMKQHLFIHAMLAGGFVMSAAARTTGIGVQTVRDWETRDPRFRKMLADVILAKKDFVERRTLDFVAMRPEVAVAVNATLNRDRGYGRQIDVNVSGQINHTHTIVPLEVLDSLPVDVCEQLLEGVRAYKAKQLNPPPPSPTPAQLPGPAAQDSGEELEAEAGQSNAGD